MCMFSRPATPDAPQMATEYAATKMPNQAAGDQAGNRQRNQQRAAASTILTSGSGVMSGASTDKKTLLGA